VAGGFGRGDHISLELVVHLANPFGLHRQFGRFTGADRADIGLGFCFGLGFGDAGIA
jgi:hypothetical protein